MARMIFCVVTGLVLALVTGDRGFAATTSPGKESVHVSSDSPTTLSSTITADLLTGKIVKGKSKRVLVIEATVTTSSSPSGSEIIVYPQVNGLTPEGPAAVDGTCSNNCSASGVWWLDLDAAEAANPGTIKGQELTIDLFVFPNSGAPLTPAGTANASMSVRMQKK